MVYIIQGRIGNHEIQKTFDVKLKIKRIEETFLKLDSIFSILTIFNFRINSFFNPPTLYNVP